MTSQRCRWRVKPNRFGDWTEFPGEHTGTEIWRLQWQGRFAAAEPIEDPGVSSILSATGSGQLNKRNAG